MHHLGGCEVAAQWSPLPLSPLCFTYKYRGGEHKSRARKGQGERPKERKNKKTQRGRKVGRTREEKKEKKERKTGEDKGEETVHRLQPPPATTACHREPPAVPPLQVTGSSPPFVSLPASLAFLYTEC